MISVGPRVPSCVAEDTTKRSSAFASRRHRRRGLDRGAKHRDNCLPSRCGYDEVQHEKNPVSVSRLGDSWTLAATTSLGTACGICIASLPCFAQDFLPLTKVAEVSAIVQLKRGTDVSALGPLPTLFLTARPVSYNAPYASLQVATSLEPAAFPLEAKLGTEGDLQVPPEQFEVLSGILEGSDVIVTARLDKDGDLRTRDAEDLVGRGVARWQPSCGCHETARVVLEGRGVFGRMATGSSSR